jgi:hypothetical protein
MKSVDRRGRGLDERSKLNLRRTTPRAQKAHTSPLAAFAGRGCYRSACLWPSLRALLLTSTTRPPPNGACSTGHVQMWQIWRPIEPVWNFGRRVGASLSPIGQDRPL